MHRHQKSTSHILYTFSGVQRPGLRSSLRKLRFECHIPLELCASASQGSIAKRTFTVTRTLPAPITLSSATSSLLPVDTRLAFHQLPQTTSSASRRRGTFLAGGGNIKTDDFSHFPIWVHDSPHNELSVAWWKGRISASVIACA